MLWMTTKEFTMHIFLLLAFVLMSALFLNTCGGGSSSSDRTNVAVPPTEPPAEPPFVSPADNAVTVDGKVWLQPADFTGYTFEQVNAVCSGPAGACSGSLQGSTFDLTGYKWASIMDVSSLFNAYGVNPPFTEPFQYRADDDANNAISRDFAITANECFGDCPINLIFVAGMVRDQAPAEIAPYVAVAYRNETSEFYNTTPLTEGSETPPHPGFQTPDDGIGVWLWRPELDTVSVDGREWAQVDLFTNLSWNDINAVCPEGACAGLLNGYNMNGWTWASVDDFNQLLSYYIGTDVGPAPYSNRTEDAELKWTHPFFADGWRERGQVYGWLRDLADEKNAYEGAVDIHYFAGFIFSGVYVIEDEIFHQSEQRGGWFYRSL
jgi:hypothetical protein